MNSTGRGAVVLFLAASFTLAMSPRFANAQAVVDQENAGVGNGGQQVSFGGFVAQTFTVGMDGNLTEIVLHLKQNGCDAVVDNLNFQLFETSAGLPSGAPIATGFVTPAEVPSRFSPYAPVSFAIPNIPVQVGDVLAVKLVTDAPENGCNYAWWGSSLNPDGPYAGGVAMRFFYFSSPSNRITQTLNTLDMAFQTLVAPAVISLDIDIKPGSDPNSINLCSNGTVPVAIFASDAVAAENINTETLRFADASVKVVGKKDPHSLCSFEDVNGDYEYDLVCHFITSDIAAIDGESTTATVNGELLDGTAIEGTDSINIVKDTCN